ncbi:MAG TPA: hypothetical protein VIK01_10420 [Polyangiaceae bacterium]
MPLVTIGGAVLFVVLIAVAGALRSHSAAGGRPEPSADRIAASAPPVVGLTSLALPSVEPAVTEQVVVPLERLPLASATPPGVLPRDLPKKPADAVRSLATVPPVSLAESARPAPAPPPVALPADPYSTRH